MWEEREGYHFLPPWTPIRAFDSSHLHQVKPSVAYTGSVNMRIWVSFYVCEGILQRER
jgi:hypothetical protein